MHTDQDDSTQYIHHITGIQVFKGELLEEFIIYYHHT